MSPTKEISSTLPVTQPRVASSTKGPNKILFLDGVRGLAAILVVTQHSHFMSDLFLGAVGVDTFFVLSSFLLTMIFERKARQLLQQKASYRKWFFALLDYFTKRFLRVYPLFACVAIFLWLLPNDAKTNYFNITKPEQFNLLKVLLFTHGYRYHVFWSLPVEISYYFLLPIFVIIILALRKFWWIVVPPLYIWIIYSCGFGYRRASYPIVVHIPTFIAGSLAAILYARIDQYIKKHRITFKSWHIVCIRLVEYIAMAFFLSTVFHGLLFHWVIEDPFPQTKERAFPFVSLYVTIMIVAEMIAPSAIARIFEWNVLVYTGKVSYSMYLLHCFIIYNYTIRHLQYYDRLIGQFFLVYILSTISYHVVEYPVQKLAMKLSKYFQYLADVHIDESKSKSYASHSTNA